MAKPLSLRLIYTSNLRGDISSLPRLFTFIQRHLRALGPGALLLDLGNCCADEAWHCRATGGRSMLIALDGMGYHAANVTDALDARERLKLARGVTMALVDQDHAWRYHVPPRSDPSLVVTARPCKSDARLQIDMRPADRMRIAGNVLFLRDVRAGQIGSVSVDLLPSPRIRSASVRDLPPGTPPHPSIAAAVEFVENEARLFQRKQSARA